MLTKPCYVLGLGRIANDEQELTEVSLFAFSKPSVDRQGCREANARQARSLALPNSYGRECGSTLLCMLKNGRAS